MITAEELRIGNWVWGYEVGQANGDKPVQINSGTLNWIDTGKIKEFSPLTLTEEWLVKLGFKLDQLFEDSEFYYYKGRMSIQQNQLTCISWDGLTLDLDKVSEIKYVHQLQNLFHALSGTELTLSNQANQI